MNRTGHRRSSSLTTREVSLDAGAVAVVQTTLASTLQAWVLLGYSTGRATLAVIRTGCAEEDGPVSDNLPTDALVYGLFRVHLPSRRDAGSPPLPASPALPDMAAPSCVVSFAFLGPEAPITARAQWTAHRKGFALQLRRHVNIHLHCEAQRPRELAPAAVLPKLQAHRRHHSASDSRASATAVSLSSTPHLGKAIDLSDPGLRRLFECIHSEDDMTNWMVCGYDKSGTGTKLVALAHGPDPYAALAQHPGEAGPKDLFHFVTNSDVDVRYVYLRLNAQPRVATAAGAVHATSGGLGGSGAATTESVPGAGSGMGAAQSSPVPGGVWAGHRPTWGVKSPSGAATYVLITWLGMGERSASSGDDDTDAYLHRTPGKDTVQARAAIVAHSGAVRHFFVHHIHVSACVFADLAPAVIMRLVRTITHVDHIRLTVEALSISTGGADVAPLVVDIGCAESVARLKEEVEAQLGCAVRLYRLGQAAPHSNDTNMSDAEAAAPARRGHTRVASPRTLSALAHPLPTDGTSVSRWLAHGDTVYAECLGTVAPAAAVAVAVAVAVAASASVPASTALPSAHASASVSPATAGKHGGGRKPPPPPPVSTAITPRAGSSEDQDDNRSRGGGGGGGGDDDSGGDGDDDDSDGDGGECGGKGGGSSAPSGAPTALAPARPGPGTKPRRAKAPAPPGAPRDISRSIAERKTMRLQALMRRRMERIGRVTGPAPKPPSLPKGVVPSGKPAVARPPATDDDDDDDDDSSTGGGVRPSSLRQALAGLRPVPVRAAQPPVSTTATPAPGGSDAEPSGGTDAGAGAGPPESPTADYLEVDFDEIERLNVLGEGRTAVVYRALWHTDHPESSADAAAGFEVAVKVFKYIRALPPPAVKAAFRKELAAMSVQHPNLITIIGATTHPRLALVMSYASQGTIHGVLRDSAFDLSRLHRAWLGLDVARGLAHLHSRGMLHRDIKSSNVLLDLGAGRLVAKIADFGTTKELSTLGGVDEKAFTAVGTSGYTAPEVLGGMDIEGYGKGADVWSFGVLLWELLTPDPRANRFVGMPAVRYCRELEGGQRLSLPATVDAELRELVQRCWIWEPEKRPTMPVVVQVLTSVCDRLFADTKP